MGALGARKGNWSLLADVIYLNIKDDQHGSARVLRRNINTKVDVELEAWIVTLAGGYTVMETGSFDVDLLAGARYIWIEVPLKFDLGRTQAKISPSGHNWDGIVGARGKVALSDAWYLSYYGDVGAGDSDLTWQATLGLNYKFESVDAVLGYRYLDYDFNGDIEDLTVKGPFAGVKFLF